jgi:hypothetical protein
MTTGRLLANERSLAHERGRQRRPERERAVSEMSPRGNDLAAVIPDRDAPGRLIDGDPVVDVVEDQVLGRWRHMSGPMAPDRNRHEDPGALLFVHRGGGLDIGRRRGDVRLGVGITRDVASDRDRAGKTTQEHSECHRRNNVTVDTTT